MIEIYENLYIGGEKDERALRGQPDWFFVHACKEPYHRDALGYTGRAAPNTHPEYLIAHRPGRLILNLVDVDNVAYISPIIIDTALDVMQQQLSRNKVLLHCNQGMSRSPTIGLLYLIKHTAAFDGLSMEAAVTAFTVTYPPFSPAKGMADYLIGNWSRYSDR
ncbi:hypothetical protein ABAC460_13085 [Asticcacaulis sp. AC460]|uniref:dual specificity protein phosphatase family protein n=1 Tax=Asticcacaulis sp. AC460 TaxID=1282360 RepID=UPI0003C3F051|nr:dual specificity protein phosphatase family protein [Asticcacaulis sp. AC460]ESQ89225.1 hypothetical protein ABAC460_13085 [Asticcacaulis sp. AC460]